MMVFLVVVLLLLLLLLLLHRALCFLLEYSPFCGCSSGVVQRAVTQDQDSPAEAGGSCEAGQWLVYLERFHGKVWRNMISHFYFYF